MTDVHIINHTHWDREWFLTHEYTTAWIPALIDSLEALAAANPSYEYLFDGQTLAVEDLLSLAPEYGDRVRSLISGGQLSIGPCYSQPDWRMTGGELQLRNLLFGAADGEALGATNDVAWLVDTFGHISQAPQLLSLVGINAAYVWRGVPQMVPLFRWRGSDGSEVAGIDLFGGYRNLYGITKTPEIAVDRLVVETEKLSEAYGAFPVPLFDGYDLDSEPEDPVTYYADLEVPEHVKVHASSPRRYADALMPHLATATVIDGELISGKFGSTFPGSLSARTYLKVLQHDCENALHRRVEPLLTMANLLGANLDTSAIEANDRRLLQNAVHDCLCGVSIDQVHERMERSYRQILGWADTQQSGLMRTILSGFRPGSYAVSTNAIPTNAVIRCREGAATVATSGVGITPVSALHEIRHTNVRAEHFEWSNENYQAVVDRQGIYIDGVGRLARLLLTADAGDTYSSEPGELLGELTMTGSPIKLDESDVDTTIRTVWTMQTGDIKVDATVDARFDDGPIVDLRIVLDSSGTAFRLDAEFETGIQAEVAHVSMPFDVVERRHEDNDLLGFTIDDELASILMGQRETGHVTEFPMHDFVALSETDRTCAVLGKGLRSYQSNGDGRLVVGLRRSVEWLALSGLKLRSGDAGPAMYVPDARSERTIEHRIGFAVLAGGLDESGLIGHNEAFHNPPVVATVSGTDVGSADSWTLLTAPLPLTALTTVDNRVLARLYNPSSQELTIDSLAERVSARGDSGEQAATVRGKEIVTAVVTAKEPLPSLASTELREACSVATLNPIQNRVGRSRAKPAKEELADLESRIEALTQQLEVNNAKLAASSGPDRYRLTHHEYVLDRERLELALSLELNQRLAKSTDEVSIPDEVDPVIADLGARLNDLRIRRRIYDYVVAAMPASEPIG